MTQKKIRDQELFEKYATIAETETLLKEQQQEAVEENDEASKAMLDNALKKLTREKEQVRNELAEKNRPLVTYMVNKYYNKTEHKKAREDLLQEGCMGLMNAIDGFDVTKGFKFSTYATWWIRQAINNYLASATPIIHIPTHIRTAQNKLLRNMSEAGQPFRGEFEALFQQEAQKLEYSDKMTSSIKRALEAKRVTSMEAPIKRSVEAGSTFTLKDLIPDESAVAMDAKVDSQTIVDIISKGLKKLPPKKRNIILLRFNVINEADIPERKPTK